MFRVRERRTAGNREHRRKRVRACAIERLESRRVLTGIVNGDFETGDLAPWGQFGAEPIVAVVQSPEPVQEGAFATKVTNRVASFQGIHQDITGTLQEGVEYEVSAWVRLATPGASEEVTLQMVVVDDDGTRYINAGRALVSDSSWSQLRGGYYHTINGTEQEVDFQVMGAPAGIDFFVDDVTFTEYDWLTKANNDIESNRRRDATVTLVDQDGQPVLASAIDIRQTSTEFQVGSAIRFDELDVANYTDFFLDNFHVAVPEFELKWRSVEASRDAYDFSSLESVLTFAQSNGIPLRGHNIFWGSEAGLPDWVADPNGNLLITPSELQAEMGSHLAALLNRYASDFESFDVINEMNDLTFFRDQLDAQPGDDIRRDVYQDAKTLVPQATLFTNDFGVIDGLFRLNYTETIDDLIAAGAPVDALGLEAHLNRGFSALNMEIGFDTAAAFGLPMLVTELDVVNSDPAKRADGIERALRTAFARPDVDGAILWGFWAGNHWLGEDAALVDVDWTVNAAGQRFLDLIDEWSTEVVGAGDQVSFRGYHGEYDVTIELPDGSTHTTVMSIDSGASVPQDISLVVCETLVTNINDMGDGSLRSAIGCANDMAGTQTIAFDIPGSGPHVIQPLTRLPQITDSVFVDGGSTPVPNVVLDGSSVLGSNVDGLWILADNVTIDSIAVTNFSGDGIDVRGNDFTVTNSYIGVSPVTQAAEGNDRFGIHVYNADRAQVGQPAAGNVIADNYFGIRLNQSNRSNVIDNVIGLLADGVTSAGNAIQGISLKDSNLTTIGEPTAGNTIAANGGNAISLQGSNENVIQSNFVGVGTDGTTPAGNQLEGILLASSGNNLVGGTDPSMRNVVVGSGAYAITSIQVASTNNRIIGNWIGVDASGVTTAANAGGVRLDNRTSRNLISGNVIAGNNGHGVRVKLATTFDNLISQNVIGLLPDGVTAAGNTGDGVILLGSRANVIEDNVIAANRFGISLFYAANNNVIRNNKIGVDANELISGVGQAADGVLISGSNDTTVEGNTIADNRRGIWVVSGIRNRLTSNLTYANSQLAIDLGTVGTDPNDAGDADTGANDVQNNVQWIAPPVISGADIVFTYFIDSAPTATAYPHTVEFFISDAAGGALTSFAIGSFDEADYTAGSKTETFVGIASELLGDETFVASVTDVFGNTSELSVVVLL